LPYTTRFRSHRARRPPGQGQGTGPRSRAGPLRHDAALDHARARHVPREVPRVPGGPAGRGAESGGGAEKGAGGGEGVRGGRWLRLWFSFHELVDRRTYLVHGAGLMLFKYGVDAAGGWAVTHRLGAALTYLNPVWTLRGELLRDAPVWRPPGVGLRAVPVP